MVFRRTNVFIFINGRFRRREAFLFFQLNRSLRNFYRFHLVLYLRVGGSTFFHPTFNENFVGDDGRFVKYPQRVRSPRHVRSFPSSIVRRGSTRVKASVRVPRDVRIVRRTRVPSGCGVRLIKDDHVASDDEGQSFSAAHPPIAASFSDKEGKVRLYVTSRKAIHRVGYA